MQSSSQRTELINEFFSKIKIIRTRKQIFVQTKCTLNNLFGIFKMWLLKMLQIPAENSKFAFTLNLHTKFQPSELQNLWH